MKKVFSFFCFIVSAMMLSMYLSSCNSCSGGSDIHFIPETPDSTMYVRLDAVNGDTMNVVLLEDGTKMVFNFAKAKQNGAVHGQLNVGDSLAIMADLKTKSLRSAINLSDATLTFNMIPGSATSDCVLEVKLIVKDQWGIQTTMNGTINVNTSHAGAKKH